MMASELRDAIVRAHIERDQEVGAAKAEYQDAEKPLAAKRIQRTKNARDKCRRRVRELREQFAREQADA